MALMKGSKHRVAVHRAARELTSPVARRLLLESTGVVDDYSDGRTDSLRSPSAIAYALSRPQERVRQDPETPIALSSAWVEVAPRTLPARAPADPFQSRRMRQIMVERLAGARAENLRKLRLLTRGARFGVLGMALRCAERSARREVLFARARLEYYEGRGRGRPEPRKRHWRRSVYSLIGC